MTPAPDPDIDAQVAALSARLEELAARKAATEQRVRDLMAAEDHKAGISHAREIHEARQEKLVLETEMEIARRTRNRLTMPL